VTLGGRKSSIKLCARKTPAQIKTSIFTAGVMKLRQSKRIRGAPNLVPIDKVYGGISRGVKRGFFAMSQGSRQPFSGAAPKRHGHPSLKPRRRGNPRKHWLDHFGPRASSHRFFPATIQRPQFSFLHFHGNKAAERVTAGALVILTHKRK
jgi:hypothetical protein